MLYFAELEQAVKEIENAERIAPAGTYEHDLFVKSALMSAWPKIKAYMRINRTIAITTASIGK